MEDEDVSPRFSWMKRHAVFKLKSISLLIITIVFIYLEVQSSLTHNWDSSRSVGLKEAGSSICAVPWKTYLVSDSPRADLTASSTVSETTLSIPLVYKLLDDGSQVCFTETTLSFCFSKVFSVSPYNKLNTGVLKELFAPATSRTYFPCGSWIVLFSTLSLFITQIYERKTRLFIPSRLAEALSDHSQSRLMTKANYLLCYAIVGLLGVSAIQFITVFEEDCQLLFRGTPGDSTLQDGKSFCNGLAACNAKVTSVIAPDSFIVQNYMAVLLVMMTSLFFSTGIQCCSRKLCGHDPEDDLFVVNRTSFRDGSMRSVSGRNALTLLEQIRGRRESDGDRRSRTLARAERMASTWTIVPMADMLHPGDSKYDGECSICLTPLCADRVRKSLRKKPSATLRSAFALMGGDLDRSDRGSGRLRALPSPMTSVRMKPVPTMHAHGYSGGHGSGGGLCIEAGSPGNLGLMSSLPLETYEQNKSPDLLTRLSRSGSIGSSGRYALPGLVTPQSVVDTVLATASGGGSAGTGTGMGGGVDVDLGRVDLEASRRVDLEASRRVDLEASRRVDLEASRRVDLEASRRVDLEASRRVPWHGKLPSLVTSGSATPTNHVVGGAAAVSVTAATIAAAAAGGGAGGGGESGREGGGERGGEKGKEGGRERGGVVGESPAVWLEHSDRHDSGIDLFTALSNILSPPSPSPTPAPAPAPALVPSHAGNPTGNSASAWVSVEEDGSGAVPLPPLTLSLSRPDSVSASAISSPRSGLGGGAEPLDSDVAVEISCKHLFHRSCLKEWAVTSTYCPLCRGCLGEAVVRVSGSVESN